MCLALFSNHACTTVLYLGTGSNLNSLSAFHSVILHAGAPEAVAQDEEHASFTYCTRGRSQFYGVADGAKRICMQERTALMAALTAHANLQQAARTFLSLRTAKPGADVDKAEERFAKVNAEQFLFYGTS